MTKPGTELIVTHLVLRLHLGHHWRISSDYLWNVCKRMRCIDNKRPHEQWKYYSREPL